MIQPRLRTLLRRTLTAAGLGALAAAVPGTASAQVSGGDWAGYAASSSTYTSVTATWVQPKLTCGAADADVAFWVGMDGITDPTLEQAGTESGCAGGTAEYEAWYEMYPAAPVYLSQRLSPGDSVTATVSATTAGVFTLTVKDTTAGWTASSKHTDTSAQRSSAEVALEVPSAGGITSGGGGSVTFTAAKVDGASLGAADPTLYSGTDASCGPLVGGTAFTCTWG